MTGLSKITDKIIAEATAEANLRISEAEAECKKIAASYEDKAAQIKEKMNSDAEREAQAIISRAKSGAAMTRRNVEMSARGQLIDRAFADAKKEMLSLPDEKYLELLVSMLVSILMSRVEDEKVSRELYGEEDAPSTDSYEVILNVRDREKFGKNLIDGVRRRLVGKESIGITQKVVLSASTADIDGGLILRYGDIEINSSVSMLFEQARPSLEAKVSHVLFE